MAGTIDSQLDLVKDSDEVKRLLAGIDEIWAANTAGLRNENVIFTLKLWPERDRARISNRSGFPGVQSRLIRRISFTKSSMTSFRALACVQAANAHTTFSRNIGSTRSRFPRLICAITRNHTDVSFSSFCTIPIPVDAIEFLDDPRCS